MGGLNATIKRFMQNKNTVTVFIIVGAIVLCYAIYTIRVRIAVTPVEVPYAVEQISAGSKITRSLIAYRKVPPSMLEGEVIKNSSELINKYVKTDTIIPSGSLFYRRNVVEEEEVNTNEILEYPRGYSLYNLAVNTSITYGNSIFPNNYIDIWVKAANYVNENNMYDKSIANALMYEKLFSNVKVLAVKDSSGRPVFQNLDEARTPSMIVFALPEEYFTVLNLVREMSMYKASIEIVPTNASLNEEPPALEVNKKMVEWVRRNTAEYSG